MRHEEQRRCCSRPDRKSDGATVVNMLKRGLLFLGALYIGAALIAHAQERRGAIRCECGEDCWCKRPGLSLFRWVFPFGHKPR